MASSTGALAGFPPRCFGNPRGRKRTIPMKLLCSGMSRSGTETLCKALTILGYECYHGWQVIFNPHASALWTEAIEAKYENKGPTTWTTAEEFDQLLGDCDAVTDFPCAAFVTELVEAYPNAKIILNTRDLGSWKASFEKTLLASRESRFLWVLSWFSWEWNALRSMWVRLLDHYFRRDFRRNSDQVRREHHALVRGAAVDREFLEYDVKEGWEPLCNFLNKDIPKEKFPTGNAKTEYETKLDTTLRPVLAKALRNMVLTLVLAMISGGYAAWQLRRRVRAVGR